jgi:hypothetical protein
MGRMKRMKSLLRNALLLHPLIPHLPPGVSMYETLSTADAAYVEASISVSCFALF